MLECMNEWTDYELRIINDYEKRCEICGSDRGVSKEINAIMLKKPFETAQAEALNRYNQGIKKSDLGRY